MIVDGKAAELRADFCIAICLPVDRVLIGRHESNPRSNNHYKESYKILWKKVFETQSVGTKPLLAVLGKAAPKQFRRSG